jgi:hypothetical protein
MPEVADKDSFNINVEIKNEGKAEAVISLQSSVNNQIQEMIIPAGETRLLQYTQQITGDSTYTFTFTGDIDQTITKTVLYGLSAAITITSSNVYPEGKVAILITIINIGQLDEALNVDFILQPSKQLQAQLIRYITISKREVISYQLLANSQPFLQWQISQSEKKMK